MVFVVLVSPVFLPLLGAFKSSGDPIYGKGATAFPQHWSLNAFGELFRTTDIVRYIANLFAVCGLNIVSAWSSPRSVATCSPARDGRVEAW
ncbi:hypothetical protein JCM18916_1500 [Cutibacterium acnes JCM 18916]|nr:hypothetical protein JCM18916_1500 [Cutibacterium acnes JCM 18916]GAE75735.1 hypothetical protein JCM18918_1462 [Cutibacterium acnes JCM 18918]